MVLTICSEGMSAVDLPFLFQLGPAETRRIPLSFGHLDLFFVESKPDKITIALVLSLDPIQLAPQKEPAGFNAPPLTQYLNPQIFQVSARLAVALEEAFPELLEQDTSPKHKVPHQATIELSPLFLKDNPSQWDQLWLALGYKVERKPLEGNDLYASCITGSFSIPEILQHLQILIALSDPQCTLSMSSETMQAMLQRAGSWLSGYAEAEWVATKLQFPSMNLHQSMLHQLSPGKESAVPIAADHRVGLSSGDQAISELLKEMKSSRVLVLENADGPLCWHLLQENPNLHLTVVSTNDQSYRIAANYLVAQTNWDEKSNQISLLPGSAFHKDDRLKGFDTVLVPGFFPGLPRFRQQQLLRNLFEEVKPTCLVFSGTFQEIKEARTFQKQIGKAARKYGYGSRMLEVPPSDTSAGTTCQLAFLHPLPNA